MVMTTMTMMIAHHLEVMMAIENIKRSRQRKSEAVKRKTIKRKRVGKEIERIIRLIASHLKMIEDEGIANVEAMKTPPMMNHMMMTRGGETNVNDRENAMIQIVLPTHPEVMIERKAKRGRNTNQSLPNNNYFHLLKMMTYIIYAPLHHELM